MIESPRVDLVKVLFEEVLLRRSLVPFFFLSEDLLLMRSISWSWKQKIEKLSTNFNESEWRLTIFVQLLRNTKYEAANSLRIDFRWLDAFFKPSLLMLATGCETELPSLMSIDDEWKKKRLYTRCTLLIGYILITLELKKS